MIGEWIKGGFKFSSSYMAEQLLKIVNPAPNHKKSKRKRELFVMKALFFMYSYFTPT
jgi:hypothetical protein